MAGSSLKKKAEVYIAPEGTPEYKRLCKIWQDHIDKFQHETVECTKEVTINPFTIKEGDTVTVKEVHMYMGVIPLLEFTEYPKKMWRPDKFNIKTYD